MKVAKRFRWEAAHRLPWHEAECKHVHGHSYRMMVEVEGEPTEDTAGGPSMLIDFKHVKRLVKPMVEAMDHATIVAASDTALKEAMDALGTKTYEMEVDTTAENLAAHVAERIRDEGRAVLQKHGVETIRVQVWETETCYAEAERQVTASGEASVATEDVEVDPARMSA
jgi:6-pyruvoyltetrahydropterin/6-carboxytetrahydropterin synthase